MIVCPIEQVAVDVSPSSGAVLVVVVTKGGAHSLNDDFYNISQTQTLDFELDFSKIKENKYVLTPYILNDVSYLFRLKSCLFTRTTGCYFFCYLNDLPTGFLGKIKTANDNTFLVQLFLQQRQVRPIQFKISTFGDQIKFRLLPGKEVFCVMYKNEASVLCLGFPLYFFGPGIYIDLSEVAYIGSFHPTSAGMRAIVHVSELFECFRNMFFYFDTELFKQFILYANLSDFDDFFTFIHEESYRVLIDSEKHLIILKYLLTRIPHSHSFISFVIFILNLGGFSILPTEHFHPFKHVFKVRNLTEQLVRLIDIKHRVIRLAYSKSENNFVQLSSLHSIYSCIRVGMSSYDAPDLLLRVCAGVRRMFFNNSNVLLRSDSKYRCDIYCIFVLILLHILRVNYLKDMDISENHFSYSLDSYGALPSDRAVMFYEIRNFVTKNMLQDAVGFGRNSLLKDINLMLLIVERLVIKRCHNNYKVRVNSFFNGKQAYLCDSSRYYSVDYVASLLKMNKKYIQNFDVWQADIAAIKENNVLTARSNRRLSAAIELGGFNLD